MLVAMFSPINCEVVTATSAAEALSLIHNQRFDLYILDHRFPRLSGVDLCKRIRASNPHVPIIFYSGAAYEVDRRDGLDAGAQAYVVKPRVEELIEAVRSTLGGCQ